MTTDPLNRLFELVDSLGSVDEAIGLADAVAASGDRSLLPRLEAAMGRFLGEGNFYAREILGGVIASLGGTGTLPLLLRASAVDLGDDQDGLATEIVDLVQSDPDGARTLLEALTKDADPVVAERAAWALRFLPGPPRA
ncbi:hypothetical protein QMZ92_14755 [Streptomyces sp. HNM0645]|uniref:hypothetical protein n=1 Tax=Streptomyces sp. HNM0645 TaxID=2782343 RepID=UPI0024B65B32|nr:hypothetical protein [Streptomyces sp. HNM0645]MDI9885612.1 hypothetical protein [Streptomyces sp. HNM0645]